MKRIIISCCFIYFLSVCAWAKPVELLPKYPQRYVVKQGDTLWDIAGKFLKNPWQWREIWQANPQIKNPHRIYPGDVLVLRMVDGKPALVMTRHADTIKLSPRIRSTKLFNAIPTIPLTAIKPFLTESLVLAPQQYKKAPYVLASADQREAAMTGDEIYVRGILARNTKTFTVFRRGEVYKDPKSGEILGISAVHVGRAVLQRRGDPATLLVTQVREEIQQGYRLCPDIEEYVSPYFYPHAPRAKMTGQIIAVLKGISQIGRGDIVVINKGKNDRIDVGTVMAIEEDGGFAVDKKEKGGFFKRPAPIKLPNRHVGELMVFRTFERVSYALVMRADDIVEVGDFLINP